MDSHTRLCTQATRACVTLLPACSDNQTRQRNISLVRSGKLSKQEDTGEWPDARALSAGTTLCRLSLNNPGKKTCLCLALQHSRAYTTRGSALTTLLSTSKPRPLSITCSRTKARASSLLACFRRRTASACPAATFASSSWRLRIASQPAVKILSYVAGLHCPAKLLSTFESAWIPQKRFHLPGYTELSLPRCPPHRKERTHANHVFPHWRGVWISHCFPFVSSALGKAHEQHETHPE